MWTCPGGSFSQQRAQAQVGFPATHVAHGGSTLEQSISEGLHSVERIHAGVVLKGLYPVAGTLCWRSKQLGEEGAAEIKCYESITTPSFPCPCTTQWERGRRIGNEEVKLSLGKMGVLVLFLFLVILLIIHFHLAIN